MSRKQRRARAKADRSARRIRAFRRLVETFGVPGVVSGLHSACRDCSAGGELEIHPDGAVIVRVLHGEGCPVLAGAVAWQPVPIDDDDLLA